MNYLSLIPVALALLLATEGCSSAGMRTGAKLGDAQEGPAVYYARTEPGTIELNRELQPMRPPTVLADIKDFTARIAEVSLKFEGVPLEIPMENIGGSTWRAVLTPRQLELLAVKGQTIRYAAHVVVVNENGKTGQTEKPVEVSVRTPLVADAVMGSGSG